MTTIADVAKKAGVSVATVSRVINNTGFVSEPLRERVGAAMEALQYRPNQFAKSLRQNKSFGVAMIVSDLTNPFFTSVARGLEEVLQTYDHHLIVCNADEDPDTERKCVELICDKRVDAVVWSPRIHSLTHLQTFRERGIPVVFIDRQLKEVENDAVLLDNIAGGHKATAHLLSLGHRRIAIVTGLSDISTTIDRFEGYKQALEDAGIPFDSGLVAHSDSRVHSAKEATKSILAANPTAIVATNNMITIGVIKALRSEGVRVPQQIAVVGFDDFPSAEIVDPPLTMVTQPMGEIGRQAAALVMKRMSKPLQDGDTPVVIRLPAGFIVRHSCGASLAKGGSGASPALSRR